MNIRLKKWIYALFAILIIFGLSRLYYRLTDDFRIANITYDLPFTPPWKVPHLTLDEYKNLEKILSQTFSYIGKGAQCYAFKSEDGKFVLKFFKFKHL